MVKNYGLIDKTGKKRGNLLINLIIKYPTNIDSLNLKKILSKNI